MAKPKAPNQKSKYKALNRRLAKYVLLVQDIYDSLNKEGARIVLGTGYDADAVTPFRFSDYPQTKAKVEVLQAKFVSELNTLIYRGTSEEWKQSNLVQDLLADKVLKAYTAQVNRAKHKAYYQVNSDALKAFQQRKEKGLNVSAKLWKQSKTYKEGLEAAISTAIKKGTSAVTLSKQISKYLTDFKSLQKDYKERFGTATKAQDCEYRSIRLARSEINMAYRKAENERWRQMDFVVGYEIKPSEKHPKSDICDILKGKYPKDFEWTGWHPNCMDYKVPILKTEDEFFADDDAISKNEVMDVPDGFNNWVLENKEKIEAANKRGTLPYFANDNEMYIIKSVANNNGGLTLREIETITSAKEDVITDEIFCRNGRYTDKRKSLHDAIVSDYMEGYDVKGGTIYMLGGAPANGKSTLVNSGKLPHPQGALVIDADEIKKRIPEYGIMAKSGNSSLVQKAANFVHEESSMLGKRIQSEAIERDLSFVIDGVNDGSFESVVRKVGKIRKSCNRKIRVDYVTLDSELSIKLAQQRAEKTGRVVPLKYIKDCNSEISKLVPRLIEENVFDELYLWDTNENGNPRLIAKLVNGKSEIVDKLLWDRFLSKAN